MSGTGWPPLRSTTIFSSRPSRKTHASIAGRPGRNKRGGQEHESSKEPDHTSNQDRKHAETQADRSRAGNQSQRSTRGSANDGVNQPEQRFDASENNDGCIILSAFKQQQRRAHRWPAGSAPPARCSARARPTRAAASRAAPGTYCRHQAINNNSIESGSSRIERLTKQGYHYQSWNSRSHCDMMVAGHTMRCGPSDTLCDDACSPARNATTWIVLPARHSDHDIE